ncbi:MAG: 5'/3'-nucleotidase SurE [Planctomycetota bacterium]|nr:5'/3'-nucleotidase SurE [Planctomycetota bacterium]
MSRPRILLTNDDGLASPGLTTLAHEIVRTGRYELRVAAPEREQSGVGHCITLHEPLLAEAMVLPDELARVPTFRVRGTPADCVKVAITNLFPDFKPDLVISGINRGPNVGMNVFYSGTVAGALEACMNELPALAVSLDVPASGLWRFQLAAELTLPLVAAALEHGLPPWTALNANLPDLPQEQIKGVKLTRQGMSGFKESYVEERVDGPHRRFRLEGAMVYRDEDPEVDAVALREGWISVTPLGLSLPNPGAVEQVKSWPIFR